jgi:hypothetical protein
VQVRGGADLAQPRLRHRVPEARDGLEQVQFPLPRRGLGRDLVLQPVDRVIEHLDAVQVQAAQPPARAPVSTGD